MNALLLAAMLFPSQCSGGSCGGGNGMQLYPSYTQTYNQPNYVTEPAVSRDAGNGCRWLRSGEYWVLMRGNQQVGNLKGNEYWPYHGNGQFGVSEQLPAGVALPDTEATTVAAKDNFGIIPWDKTKTSAYICNGKTCTKDEAFQAVGDPLPNDAKFLSVTVIGSKADTDKVSSDWNTAAPLQKAKATTLFHAYQPDNAFVQQGGFKAKELTVLVQDATGKVLHRQDSYSGPEALAEAVYKAQQAYDPSKDPNLNGTDIITMFKNFCTQLGLPPWLVAAMGGGLLWMSQQKSKPPETK